MYQAGLDHLTMDILEFWKDTNSSANGEKIMNDILPCLFSNISFLKFLSVYFPSKIICFRYLTSKFYILNPKIFNFK